MAGEIVVGYDGQEGSVAALRTATAIAAAFKTAARHRVRLPPGADRR